MNTMQPNVSRASNGGQSVLLTSTSQGAMQAAAAAPQQTLIRRPVATNTSGVVTKVIIQRQGTANSLLNPSSAPTQTITLSEGGIVSPQKILASPIKQQIIPSGKVPISPMKSPATRYVLSSGASPHKLMTTSGQMIMVTQASKANHTPTITVSPAVKLKPQQRPQVSQIEQAQRIMVSHTSSAQPAVAVTGSRFQYVRLVTNQQSQQGKLIHTQQPRSIVPQANTMKIVASNPQPQLQNRVRPIQPSGAFGPAAPRHILPATLSQPVPIQPQPNIRPAPTMSSNPIPGQIAPGTTINVVGSGMQSFALVPAQYVPQHQQQQQQQPTQTKAEPYIAQNSNSLPPQKAVISNVVSNGPVIDMTARPRKACNCTKSQCLKLYCDCFANGEFCNNCNCVNCFNNLEHEEERSRSIKICLERNPLAFHPKIGKSKGGSGNVRRHNKGCNCKRSGCLKNYCECYEAKIMCSSLCKCVGCKNYEESSDRKTLMHLADAAEVRVQQQTSTKSRMDDASTKADSSSGERLAHTFVTSEVVEAACACLLAQAEETERTRQMDIHQERLILEEFGRCLLQVIESSNRTKGEGMLVVD